MELPPPWRDWDLGLELPDDVSAAEWLVDALRPWDWHGGEGVRIASFVPDSYKAFARILHPAHGEDGRDVRWADLAAARGTIAGPDTSFSAATGIAHVNGRSVVENRTSERREPAQQAGGTARDNAGCLHRYTGSMRVLLLDRQRILGRKR